MNFKDLNRKLFRALVVGIIVIIVVSIGIDLKGFLNAFNKIEYKYIPILLMLFLCHHTLRYLKFMYYLNALDIKISLKDSLHIFLSSLPMTITPGKVGEFLKSYLLKIKYNYPISKTSPVVVLERISDGIGIIILAGIGALIFDFGESLLIAMVAILVLFTLIIQSKKLIYKIIEFGRRIKWIDHHHRAIITFYESTFKLLSISKFIIPLSMAVVAWICEGLIIYYIIRSIGIDTTVVYSTFILAVSSIAGVISMIPGGLGVAEGSIFGLLVNAGISKGDSSFIILLIRFMTLWFGVIIGILSLIKVEKEWIRKSEI